MKRITVLILPVAIFAIAACGKSGVSEKQKITTAGSRSKATPSPNVQRPAPEDEAQIEEREEEIREELRLPATNPPAVTTQPSEQPGDGVDSNGDGTGDGETGETTVESQVTPLPTGLFLRLATQCEFIGPYQDPAPLAYPFEFLGLKPEDSKMSISLLFYVADDDDTDDADTSIACQVSSIHTIDDVDGESRISDREEDGYTSLLFSFLEEKNSDPEVCDYTLAERLKREDNLFEYKVTRPDMIEVIDSSTNQCMVFMSYDSIFF